MHFIISSEQLSLLTVFSEEPTLEKVATRFQRDISVISRQLKRLSEETKLIEKIKGRYQLTSKGKKCVVWAKDASLSQAKLLNAPRQLSVGTTREFSARILTPNLAEISKRLGAKTKLKIKTKDASLETDLLNGEIDLAIDCGMPNDPEVRWKKISPERMVAVYRKSSFSGARQQTVKLETIPYLHFERNRIHSLESALGFHLSPHYTFSDLASLRAAICAGLGWSWLPYYVIREDVAHEKSDFEIFDLAPMKPLHFGVYWLSSRSKSLASETEFFSKWLLAQKLG